MCMNSKPFNVPAQKEPLRKT
uniref:Uncharacterized protein n=1 Tax=Arundo donax TaxID=35708 RepID=A0A0A9FYC9_ARUDO